MSNQSRREALRAQQKAKAEQERRKRLMVIGALVLGLVLLVAGGGALIYLNRDSIVASPGGGSQITPPNANKDKSGIIANPGKAKSGAPVLVVYQDYQCPWCKVFDAALKDTLLAKAEAGEIQLEYHTMTFLDLNLKNDASTRAAIGAACSDTVGAYSAYHEAIYAAQPQQEGSGYTDEQLRTTFPGLSGITGDNLKKFQQCYDGRATADFVNGTNTAAGRAGVTGTPTYYLNGKDVTKQVNYKDPSSIDRLIAAAK